LTTPQNPFAQPDKGDRFTPRDHPEWLGRLFLIYPDSVETRMGQDNNNQPAPYDVVVGDVAIVDLPNAETGQTFTLLKNASIGGKALVPQLKKQLGAMVLGRLAQTAAQGSKSGAYYLADYTDADVAQGMAHIQANPRQQFAQPAPQAQAPAQAAPGLPYDPWQHTQAAPAQAPAQPYPQAAPAQQYAPAQQQFPTAGAPAQAPVAQGSPQNDALVQFLTQRGINTTGMAPEQIKMIAQTFPDAPQG
jgi:hypothetical protein